jgi:hypothetical protein
MIIKLLDYFKDTSNFYFQLEYAPKKDLKTFLQTKNNLKEHETFKSKTIFI